MIVSCKSSTLCGMSLFVVMAAARSSSQQRNTGLSAGHEVVLAEAKLAPPRMRSQIERPRVTRALDAGAPALTLVAAPAGYGKTTAVRAWCARRKVLVAWVTLDASDNDPARLWRYVITAVDRVHQGLV